MEGAGTTFWRPTHREIIECLHRFFITRRELHPGISVADVYSAAPDILVAQHAQAASSGIGDDGGHGGPCYFLSSVRGVSETSKRKSRAVDGTDGKGRWHTEAGRKRVEGTAGGYMSTFSYQEKTASGTTRPGPWLMVEYSIAGCDNLVIAKIYRSPRRQATDVPPSYMASSSAAVTKTLQVSGASQASAAHYLTAAAAAAQQVSPGHADHANKVVLGHSQTVLDARYEAQGQVAQHLIPEAAIVDVGQQSMLADEVVIPSTSGDLANLDLDDDLYGCLANLLDFDADRLYPWYN